jgi:DNA polymerase epsilon subunit 2
MPALREIFDKYADSAEFKPMAFILCGNFSQRGWEGEGGLKRYTSKLPDFAGVLPG